MEDGLGVDRSMDSDGTFDQIVRCLRAGHIDVRSIDAYMEGFLIMDSRGQTQETLDRVYALGAKRKSFPRLLQNFFRKQDAIDSGGQAKDSFHAWGEPCYKADGLCSYCRNMDWMKDPKFVRAYAKGMDSGHKMGRPKGSQIDIHIEWRVHMILWAAQHATQLEGDFVECGVNTGILSLAVCDYLDFEKLSDRSFWLFDTFKGIPEDQASASERAHTIGANESCYEECYELAVRNFAPYPNAKIVKGKVPESFVDVDIKQVAYLSIDMNIAKPEVAAMEFFWDKLVKGAIVVFDDYGWAHCGEQYEALNAFARLRGVSIATLPTGQGLVIKP